MKDAADKLAELNRIVSEMSRGSYRYNENLGRIEAPDAYEDTNPWLPKEICEMFVANARPNALGFCAMKNAYPEFMSVASSVLGLRDWRDQDEPRSGAELDQRLDAAVHALELLLEKLS